MRLFSLCRNNRLNNAGLHLCTLPVGRVRASQTAGRRQSRPPCRCCSAGRSPAPTFRNGVRYEKQKNEHPHQRTRPRRHPPKSKHGKSVHYGLADIVRAQAELFINDLINKLRELMIDLRTGKAVFVGGGSILLKKYIEASDKIGCPIFIEEISANTKGYELLYKAQG